MKKVQKPEDNVLWLAKRMWATYVRANGGYKNGYVRWNELTDEETQRGFLVVAAMAQDRQP